MADQNITELPVKTSSGMASSDYMLGIDSAEGYQMLIKDLGDYIIRNVQVNTIAGANQTLKSALDTLNSKLLNGEWKNGIDLNTYRETQTLLVKDATNKPSEMTGEIWGCLEVIGRNDYCTQWLRRMGSTWTREYRNAAWSAWVQDPTRVYFNASASEFTITGTAGELYVIVTAGGGGNSLNNQAYSKIVIFTPTYGYYVVKDATNVNVSFTSGSTSITITATTTLAMFAYRL